MSNHNSRKIRTLAAMTFMVVALLSTVAFAQAKVEGLIKGRSGSTIILQGSGAAYINVMLTDSTRVASSTIPAYTPISRPVTIV